MTTGDDAQEQALLNVIQGCWTGHARIAKGVSHMEAAQRAAELGKCVLAANIIADGYAAGALDLHDHAERLVVARLVVQALSEFARIRINLAEETVKTLEAGEEVWNGFPNLEGYNVRGNMLEGLRLGVKAAIKIEAAACELAGAFVPDIVPVAPCATDPAVSWPIIEYLFSHPA